MSLLSFHQKKISRRNNEIPGHLQYFQEEINIPRGIKNSRRFPIFPGVVDNTFCVSFSALILLVG